MSFPVYPEDLTPDFLTAVISDLHPGVTVTGATVLDAKGFGETNVSTSARVTLGLEYRPGSQTLPKKALIKMLKTDDWPGRPLSDGVDGSGERSVRQRAPRFAIYKNEVDFYGYLGKEIPVEIPRPLAARFDEASKRYVLILEDVTERGANFWSQFDETSQEDIQAVLDAAAKMHARYWESPRFQDDLKWVQTQSEGPVHETVNGPVRASVHRELQRHKFKREILGRIETTESELFTGLKALQRHQSRLTRTLIHGDAHIGNTYRLPNGDVGFYDWQLFAQGFCIQDVAYLIVTTLSIALRRKYERDLLKFYIEKLVSYGVKNPPGDEMLWLEYRRAIHWCVTIGWMPCPAYAYGWELFVVANNRVSTAYEDLETKKAVAELL
ncbi:MAG: phosphotransferase [Amphiplicatus sp.]